SCGADSGAGAEGRGQAAPEDRRGGEAADDVAAVSAVILSEAKDLKQRDRDPSPSARLRMTLAALLLVAACRSTRVGEGPPLAPLTSTTEPEAARQLVERRAHFAGERSLIRLRFPNGQSARAQLQVDSALRMLLPGFPPVGHAGA